MGNCPLADITNNIVAHNSSGIVVELVLERPPIIMISIATLATLALTYSLAQMATSLPIPVSWTLRTVTST